MPSAVPAPDGGVSGTDQATTTPSRRPPIAAARGGPTLGEVLVLSAGAGFAAMTVVSLGLALLGLHHGWGATAGSLLVALVTLAVLTRRAPHPVEVSKADTLLVLGAVLVTAFMVVPGFNYGAKSKDPGVYVGHAFAIEREHSTSFPDPALDAAVPVDTTAGNSILETDAGVIRLKCCKSFGAIGPDPGRPGHLLPSFFHAWPALMATALSVGGRPALFNIGALLAILSVTAVALAVRRTLGTLAAVVAAGVLSTTMIQVWSAKYPTTEMATQCAFTLAALALAVGVELRWRPPLALAGALTGVTFLYRPDGLLLVGLLLAALAVTYGTRRADWVVGPLLGGLALILPLALYQAYESSAEYAAGKIPGPVVVTLGVLGLGAFALILRRAGRVPSVEQRWTDLSIDRWYRRARVAALVLLAAVFVAVALRPLVFGSAFGIGRSGELVRKYDEANLRRLTWFLTPAIVPLTVLGLGVISARRRVVAALSAILLPGLALLPIYLWEPRISPQLMWWTRRYVPVILVFLVVCAAAAVAWLLTHRGRWRFASVTAGAVLGIWLLATGLVQSLPLREHDEWGGSLAVTDQLAAFAEDEPAVFVWLDPDDDARSFAATLTTHHGLGSVTLAPVTPDRIQALADAYPGRRLLLVGSDDDELPGRALGNVRVPVQFWEETVEDRPDRPIRRLVDLSVAEWT